MSEDEADVFDLDAIEKEGKPFRWKFGGSLFSFPPNPPIAAIEYLSKGDLQMALWLLLGEEEYERLDALPKLMDDEEFRQLVERYFSRVGAPLGKSPKPSKSARQIPKAKALR